MADDSPEQLQLTQAHKRFRSVLTLNILVSAIINKGYPLLKLSQWKPNPPKKVTSSHLNHILAILVRDWNVIAAVAYRSDVPQGRTLGSSSEPEPYQVNVIHNLPQSSPQQDGLASGIGHGGGGGGNAPPLTNITAVANPDKQDTYFRNADANATCIVVKSGESNFSLITSPKVWENVLVLSK
jgi:hypothetical protein